MVFFSYQQQWNRSTMNDMISCDTVYSSSVVLDPKNVKIYKFIRTAGFFLLFSVIRPSTRHPHTRQIKKTDPVSRFELVTFLIISLLIILCGQINLC